MSIICIICHDNLSGIEGPEEKTVIALQCGHLFHQQCIQRWFQNQGSSGSLMSRLAECPCCKKNTSLNGALRVYPSCDEDETKSQAHSDLDAYEMQQLMDQLDHSTTEIESLTSKLETETLKSTLIKSENEKLQLDLKSMKSGIKSEETSLKLEIRNMQTAFDKLKDEHENLKREMDLMRCREQRLSQHFHTLQTLQQSVSAWKEKEKDCMDQISRDLEAPAKTPIFHSNSKSQQSAFASSPASEARPSPSWMRHDFGDRKWWKNKKAPPPPSPPPPLPTSAPPVPMPRGLWGGRVVRAQTPKNSLTKRVMMFEAREPQWSLSRRERKYLQLNQNNGWDRSIDFDGELSC